MKEYLVGVEVCEACGEQTTVVARVDVVGDADQGGPAICDNCDLRDARVAVWYPCDWPTVEALVGFDAERLRLHLPSLMGAPWQ